MVTTGREWDDTEMALTCHWSSRDDGRWSVEIPQLTSFPKAEPLIAFMNDELKLEMNTNQNVSTANSGAVIDAVFQRFLNTLKSQVYVSYFSYHKSIVSALPQIEQE
ncbi:hypothetical protein TNCV_4638171 [Trichonephila clavipes]|uniref:Uncharacterized protein n=1 Tax=Trichonephila clavipes TaxID=2585209 RepID=A0A8X6WES5_TRICX|nr:hypothetical protein TNCV_4638171 [Trichonephila clavipes]